MSAFPVVAPALWQLRSRLLPLDRPRLMGIVNVTPDSFSDGGRFFSVDDAVAHGLRLAEEGADVLDLGGESTRPGGAVPVDTAEELRRVLPVLRELQRRLAGAVPISIDTVKSEVAAAALAEGAEIVNDVSAFRLDPRGREVCAAAGAAVILMHSRGGVRDMATYAHAHYGADVAGDIIGELSASVRAAEAAGIARGHLAVDPGIGFAKRAEHSVAALASTDRLAAMGYPVVVGVSRKRVIGDLSGVVEVADRVEGTVAVNVLALALGARVFRVHDVRANRRALDAAWGVLRSRQAS